MVATLGTSPRTVLPPVRTLECVFKYSKNYTHNKQSWFRQQNRHSAYVKCFLVRRYFDVLLKKAAGTRKTRDFLAFYTSADLIKFLSLCICKYKQNLEDLAFISAFCRGRKKRRCQFHFTLGFMNPKSSKCLSSPISFL